MTDINKLIDNTLVPHSAFTFASDELEQCFQDAEGAVEPICLPIVGESRTGKSRVLETVALNHEPYRTSEGMQIPIFCVKTPSNPTVKGLAELMLIKLGDPKFDKGTEQAKTNRLQTLIKECGTRMIVIDEFQHFVDKGSSKIAYHVADWLKILADESCLAIVVAGLPNCIDVLRANEQLAGRFMAKVVMPRFVWSNDDHREEFKAILAAFHEQMTLHFDLPDLSSDEMAFRFVVATGGLIGLLTKVLKRAVSNAVKQKSHTITLEDFAAALARSIDTDFYNTVDLAPFSRTFSCKPTADLFGRIALVGKRKGDAFNRRGRSASKTKGSIGVAA